MFNLSDAINDVDTSEKNKPIKNNKIINVSINLSILIYPFKCFFISLLKHCPLCSKFLKLSNEAADGLKIIVFFKRSFLLMIVNTLFKASPKLLKLLY